MTTKNKIEKSLADDHKLPPKRIYVFIKISNIPNNGTKNRSNVISQASDRIRLSLVCLVRNIRNGAIDNHGIA